MKNNIDWAEAFMTMAERMRLCMNEEQMYQQLKKFKEEFNSEYGKLSRTERSKKGFNYD